jgi:hypothetical protein
MIVTSAMMKTSNISLSKRGLSLNAALALLFFAILSPPHRVHHVFEQSASARSFVESSADSHGHGDSQDHSHPALPAPGSTDCAVLSAAQSANCLVAASLDLPISSLTVDFTLDQPLRPLSSFNPSPRSQRAPPII